jgi:serine/threonine-protein kinase
MANVYLAVARGPSGFNKLVVLKSLRSDFAVDAELMAMFLEEARLAARLNHPHVVQTYEVGDYAGRPVIVMEYLEGQTLANVETRAKTSLPLALRLRIIINALEGLHHAHELSDFAGKPLGLVHRDISPQNVFITFDGSVKVLDFGIAKVVNSQVQTATGILKGKLRYMAPEQMLGSDELDRRADIYSIGVMLWEATGGQRMWQGHSDMQVMTQVASGALPPLRSVNPGVSESLERICTRALALDPAKRYVTALEMANDIEAELEHIATGASVRQLGQLVRDLFEDLRTRTRATIEAALLEATAGPESQNDIPSNLVNISTRIAEESPSARSGNGSFSQVATIAAKKRSRLAAWAAAGLAFVVGLTVVGFTSLGRPKHVPAASTPADPPPSALAVAVATPSASAPVAPAPAQTSAVTVALSAAPPRAILFLDGHALPSNPYKATLPADGSSHRVLAEAAGFAPRTLMLTPDHDTDVVIALDPLRGPPPRPQQAAPPAAAPPPAETTSPPKNNKCNPPYVIDADGIKRFRPECLAQ